MNFKSALEKEHTKALTNKIVKEVIKDPRQLKDLMSLVLNNFRFKKLRKISDLLILEPVEKNYRANYNVSGLLGLGLYLTFQYCIYN